MQLQGTIKKISDIQTFASGFQKNYLVLLTEEQYPQSIQIDFLSDNLDLLNTFSVGDKVKVSINIRGKQWTSPQGEVKYFNSITGWRIEHLDTEQSPQSNGMPTASPQQAFATESVNVEEEDDLPF